MTLCSGLFFPQGHVCLCSLEQSSRPTGGRGDSHPLPARGVRSPAKHMSALFSPFVPGPLAGLLLVLSCPKYPVSYFTSSGKDPTAKVPFQLSFPISLSDKLLRGGRSGSGEVGKTCSRPLCPFVKGYSGSCSSPVLCLTGQALGGG